MSRETPSDEQSAPAPDDSADASGDEWIPVHDYDAAVHRAWRAHLRALYDKSEPMPTVEMTARALADALDRAGKRG
ncbi:hypothetical protein [Halomarina pelagica]|uniref:hypothetical protein n=1 Tax=Halomarina pelagica TaxID=2961599 RepID=UPI0020C219FD|nr:hypothetical protein [Halomarina sp. BND7]